MKQSKRQYRFWQKNLSDRLCKVDVVQCRARLHANTAFLESKITIGPDRLGTGTLGRTMCRKGKWKTT